VRLTLLRHRASGSAFCPPQLETGTAFPFGSWRHIAGFAASAQCCGDVHSSLTTGLFCVLGLTYGRLFLYRLTFNTLNGLARGVLNGGVRLRSAHIDIADNGLPASFHVDMFDCDLL